MPVIVVTSANQGAGKTAVAATIARHAAYAGRSVQLVRVASNDARSHATADADWYGTLFFTPNSNPVPVAWGDIPQPTREELIVVEADADTVPEGHGYPVVTVGREGTPTDRSAAATVITRTHRSDVWVEGEMGTNLTLHLPEDRTLNGFTVDEARQMLHAETLVEGDETDVTCDYLVIAPIASDAGQPYFKRFPSKAVVARFDKTDMHLAAMQARPNVLILSGGRRPSEYLFDAAGAQGIPVLLSRTDTENTVITLERIFDRTRFVGERKLERMAGLLDGTPLYEALGL